MATRKKKDPGTLSGLPKDYPYVTIGTHLTVTEYEDGRTDLTWDDEALLREVRTALASVTEDKPAKKTRAKKNV
jgi:hypothetical protein